LSRVAGVLKQDREENPNAVQKILVRSTCKETAKIDLGIEKIYRVKKIDI